MTIGFLTRSAQDLTPEEREAWQFLSSRKHRRAKRLSTGRMPPLEDLLRLYDIIWWHSDRDPLNPQSVAPGTYETLRMFTEKGGCLLLTLLPSLLPVYLGIESEAPRIIRDALWEEESWAKGYPDIRGFATYQGHPVFAGMTGGLYSWMPHVGQRYAGTLYEETLPATGRIIGVERQYIRIIPKRRLIWEHSHGRGRILCIGTYLFFSEQQPRVRPHLELFTTNCLSYLTSSQRRRERTTYWTFDASSPRMIDRNSDPLGITGTIQDPEEISPSFSRRSEASTAGEAFDVGGRRCVIIGDERTGIREVWTHPVRCLRHLRIGIRSNGGPVSWIDQQTLDLTIRPDAVVRRTTIGALTYRDITFADPTQPAGAVHIRAEGSPSHVFLTAEIDLRLMWPLDEEATGQLRYAWDEGLQAAVVSTNSGEIAGIIGSSIAPVMTYVGASDELTVTEDGQFAPSGSSERVVHIGMCISLVPGGSGLTIAFSGSAASEREAELAYRRVTEDPADVLAAQTDLCHDLQQTYLMLRCSDTRFIDAYRWSLLSTDRFYLTTPGLGSSFVAGFGTVDRGWDGGHAVSGRPGYAWYFGRDAVWTAFAALAAGDFDKVRGVLEFLGRHQDVTGKILHELTTSGFAHFDAADATPLYLMLMGRYVRASGHRSFARSEFAKVRKALDFCFSTDTDNDSLIENTNVGHGWVEGGALFPVHVEHYLASCWASALAEASFLAEVTDRPLLSKRWKEFADRVRDIVAEDFWDEENGWYVFGKKSDGTYVREQTLLPAVGLYLGIGGGDRAQRTLKPFASSDFTVDWGVRIIGASNPMFKPTGYHYGSVWPLFTGWAALAEFRHDRPLQGYQHTLSTGSTAVHQAAGWVEEVLHGEIFQPAGVCHHQAWSGSMVVQPVAEGMLGLAANGIDHILHLSPWIPPHWSSFEASRIRVGLSWIGLSLERGEQATTVTLTLDGRQPVTVHMALRFPLGTHLKSIETDGVVQHPDRLLARYGDAPSVSTLVTSSSRIVYVHTGGYGLVPPEPDLVPGAPSRGIRILQESFEGGKYTLDFEGHTGSDHELEIVHRGRALSTHEGCDLLETYAGRSKVRIRFTGPGPLSRRKISLF